MAAVEEKVSPHVVLFPFLAHGHVPAFLRLAGLLRSRRPGLDITLVSTPRLLGSLSLPPASPPLRLHALPFAPADHGLPPGAHSLADVQVGQFITFFQASESLRPAFEEFVSGIGSPVCIVSDAFFGWTADAARARGASHAVFLPGGAFGNADEFPLPDFPDVVLHRTQIPRYTLSATGDGPLDGLLPARHRLLPQDRRAPRQHRPGTGTLRPRHAPKKLRHPAMADRASPRSVDPVRLPGRRQHHPVAGRAPAALGAVRIIRITEQHQRGSDEGAGAGAGGERRPLRLGAPPAGGVRREGRVQARVAPGRLRGAGGAGEHGAADARVGAAGADPVAPVHGRVPEPLRVELHPREPLLRRAADRVAAGGRAVLQREARGRVGRLCGGCEGQHGELGGGEGEGGRGRADGDGGGGDGRGDEKEGGGDRARHGGRVGSAGWVRGGEPGRVPEMRRDVYALRCPL